MDQGWVQCDVSRLFERIREQALSSVKTREFMSHVPEYLPPVLLTPDAERWIVFAAGLWASCVTASSRIVMDVHYEDRVALSQCALVMTMRAQSIDAQNQQLQGIAEELPARGVKLSVRSENGMAALELRFQVHHRNTPLPLHRDIILLVEDDMLVRMAALDVLEFAGYRVMQCASFKEALDRFEERERSVRLVIADITLPDGDGRALASIMHSQQKDLPVLLMSGYTQTFPLATGACVHFLAKPFNREALLAAVRTCLVEAGTNYPLPTRTGSLSARHELMPSAGA